MSNQNSSLKSWQTKKVPCCLCYRQFVYLTCRQMDRQTVCLTERQSDRKTDRHIERWKDPALLLYSLFKCTEKLENIDTEGKTDRQA